MYSLFGSREFEMIEKFVKRKCFEKRVLEKENVALVFEGRKGKKKKETEKN